MPAFREQLEDNTADPIQSSGNTEGWSRPWLRLKAVVDRIYSGKSWAWGRVVQDGSAAALLTGMNAVVTRTGVGTAHVAFQRNLPNANYAVLITARGTAGSGVALNEAIDGFDVERADIGGALADLHWNFDVKLNNTP